MDGFEKVESVAQGLSFLIKRLYFIQRFDGNLHWINLPIEKIYLGMRNPYFQVECYLKSEGISVT